MASITNLSEDLVGQILSKVPLTSLGAVRSTQKKWNALTKARVLCKGEASDQQFLGFMVMDHKFFSMRFTIHGIVNQYGEHFVDRSIKEICDNSLNHLDISKVFHCDGLLLCPTRGHSSLLVWNPYLGQARLIIEPETPYGMHDKFAMGYDKDKNHKILRFFINYDYCQFYDFKSNTWGEKDVVSNWDIECYNRGATLNGNLYFLVRAKGVLKDRGDHLLSFDLTTEEKTFHCMPFQYGSVRIRTLSSVKEEKLVALYQCWETYEMGIWMTTKINPNNMLWSNYFKVDMLPLTRFGFEFDLEAGSFFIDEEKRLAVVFNVDRSAYVEWSKARFYHTAYIVGENGYLKKVVLGEAVKVKQNVVPSPLVCTSSYVPSLVQINQVAGCKRILKRKMRG